MERTIRDSSGNPSPLGLLGFGVTTVLLNLHNAGLYGLSDMILVMGIFYGGICQIIAGMQENKKGNTFAATAFTSYGAFWLTLVALLLSNKAGLFVADDFSIGIYMFIWGLVTFIFFMGTFNAHLSSQIVFGSLTILFILLGIHFITGSAIVAKIAGFEGIFCGLVAMYEAAGILLNEKYGRTVLPL